jgi:hypothetical protein
MKINHFVCPQCGHNFYSDCAYATCDSCQTFFYASQSATTIKFPEGTVMSGVYWPIPRL